MCILLNNFCNHFKQNNNTDNKLRFPATVTLNREKILKDKDTFKEIMESKFNNLLIAKFQNLHYSSYDHLNTVIYNGNGIEELLKQIHSLKEHTIVLLQKFLNHGGYVIKLYLINNSMHVFLRPSIPDKPILNKNSYSFKTEELNTPEYKEIFENHLPDNKLLEKLDNDFMNSLLLEFSKYTGINLLGLDLIYTGEKYIIIDANNFPAYSDFKIEVDKQLRCHFYRFSEGKI